MTVRDSRMRFINRWASMLVVAILALLVNYFGGKYWASADWTQARFHSLAPRTVDALDGLDQPLRLVSLLSPATGMVDEAVYEELRATLRAIERINPKRVTLEERDPLREPAFAQAILEDPGRGLDEAINVVVVELGDRSRQISLEEMVVFEASPSVHGAAPVRALTLEREILSAIVSLSRERRPVVRFATGHGELSPEDPSGTTSLSRLVESLEAQDIRVETWTALGSEGSRVPEETDLVVVAAPALAWEEGESAALARYLESGGRLLLLVEPLSNAERSGMARTGLDSLLEGYGVSLGDALALDPAAPIAGFGAEVFYTLLRPGHPIGDPLSGQALILNLARPLRVETSPGEALRAWVLAETSVESWGETDLPSLERGARRDAADEEGPLTLAAAVERGDAPRATRLVVIGDVSVATDETFPAYAHRAFLLGAVGWLLEDEPELGLEAKDRNLTQLFLDEGEQAQMTLLVLVIIPGSALVAGFLTWWRRRRA